MLSAYYYESEKSRTFLYHNGEILTESDGESTPVRRYLNGIGLSHVQTLEDGLYHAYHQDEQGSTAYITGSNGTVENCYLYDAFGNILESHEDIENRILYTGQQYDQVTGQYYLRARYYNPVVGRFLQEDTYRGDGLNLYAYCANNPVMYYDPSGHVVCTNPEDKPQSATPAGQVGNEIPDTIEFDSKQLGKKWGKHKEDYPDMNSYSDYKDYANEVFNKPDKIIHDATNSEYLYIKGDDLLRVGEEGGFISLYPGTLSQRVKDAIENGGTVWP